MNKKCKKQYIQRAREKKKRAEDKKELTYVAKITALVGADLATVRPQPL